MIEYEHDKRPIFSVLADGRFHKTVPEGTEGAEYREYETKDGKKGGKWEIKAQAISGYLTNLDIYEGEFGKNVIIILTGEKNEEGNAEEVSISLSASSSFGEDFLKKLPNIDVEKQVRLQPYSFEGDNGKNVRGINITQGGEKLYSYYHEFDEGKKTSKQIKGYPELNQVKIKKWGSDEWKLYFGQARIFLLGELQKHDLFNESRLEPTAEDVAFEVVF